MLIEWTDKGVHSLNEWHHTLIALAVSTTSCNNWVNWSFLYGEEVGHFEAWILRIIFLKTKKIVYHLISKLLRTWSRLIKTGTSLKNAPK